MPATAGPCERLGGAAEAANEAALGRHGHGGAQIKMEVGQASLSERGTDISARAKQESFVIILLKPIKHSGGCCWQSHLC